VPPNILIVRLSAMGDVLLTTPLLRALRVKHPEARITFVTRPQYQPLLDHNPRINRVVGWNPADGLTHLVERIGREDLARFTHRLDLQRTVRSQAIRLRLGGRWTSYPKHRLPRAVLIRTKRDLYRDRRPVAERYFDAARDLGAEPDSASLEVFVPRAATTTAEQLLSPLVNQIIAVAPGAAHPTKRWPLHHWVALSRLLTDAGNDVLVIGGEMDRGIAGEMVRQWAGGNRPLGDEENPGRARIGTMQNAAGMDLPTTAALLKRCRALIAGDTGQMHLATAVGTPVVALFGPTVEAFGFFPYHAKSSVVQLDLSCRPCSAHGSRACPLKHHRCLQDLQPALVLESLRKLPR
jgi:heptosyltransferase-2